MPGGSVGGSGTRRSFLQEEDAIRDSSVTGVQTCALPISTMRGGVTPAARASPMAAVSWTWNTNRSEERRVGKECRSRGSPYHLKKKDIEHHDGLSSRDYIVVCGLSVEIRARD